MAKTSENYKNLLLSLLPRGKYWTRQSGTLFVNFFKGLAIEFNRLDDRTDDLVDESFISTTSELITEHETDFDLPEEGLTLGNTIDRRKDELTLSLLKRGEQDEAYFQELAENLGYDIDVTEFRPFWAGFGQAGDPCGDQNNIFYWRVDIDIASVEEPYEVNISRLMSKFQKLKPAHTHLLYQFYNVEFTNAFGRGFSRVPSYDNSWGLLQEKELDYDGMFSNAFANNKDYDGIAWKGSFHQAFSQQFDRDSGGHCSHSEFGLGFKKPQ
jgi:uncharacterized protein YmfQ (DUF2313 family)